MYDLVGWASGTPETGSVYRVKHKGNGRHYLVKVFPFTAHIAWATEVSHLLSVKGDDSFSQVVDYHFEPELQSLSVIVEIIKGQTLESFVHQKIEDSEKIDEKLLWHILVEIVRARFRVDFVMDLNLGNVYL